MRGVKSPELARLGEGYARLTELLVDGVVHSDGPAEVGAAIG